MIVLICNHLWQSSLCAGAAGLLALALHRNGANVRFWLWFAASVKFLVPFAALTALSAYLFAPMVTPVAAPAVALMEPLAKPFSAPAIAGAATRIITLPSTAPSEFRAPLARHALPASSIAHVDVESVLLAFWAVGFLILTIRWLVRWSRVRTLLHQAAEARVDAPIAVKFSASRLEPGLVGILRPIILLPQGIEGQVSQAELKAILAHELCHWRRQDNFTAAIHMLVEALFWFFPVVWWLGGLLNAERERACDESVLAQGTDPHMYAEGILKICRVYLQSPLACVAGISGADLKKRIETIAENRLILRLTAARKLALSASAAIMLGLPLVLGLLVAPVMRIQAKAAQFAVNNPTVNQSGGGVMGYERAAPHQIRFAKNSQSANLVAPSPDVLQLLPVGDLSTPIMAMSIEAPAMVPAVALASAAGEAPVTGANNQPAAPAQPAAQPLPDLPTSTGLLPYEIPFADGRPGPLVAASRNDLRTEYICYNSGVTGRVLSARAILIGGFTCHVDTQYKGVIGQQSFSGFIMNVELGHASDAERMVYGKTVTIGGNFKVLVKDEVRYLVADRARILSNFYHPLPGERQ